MKRYRIEIRSEEDYTYSTMAENKDGEYVKFEDLPKQEVCKLTIEDARKQFDELPNVKPYLNSNEIMRGMMDCMFCFYLEALKVNGLLED